MGSLETDRRSGEAKIISTREVVLAPRSVSRGHFCKSSSFIN